jgi:alpha-galactosidase
LTRHTSLALFAALTAVTVILMAGTFGIPGSAGTASAVTRTDPAGDPPGDFANQRPRNAFGPYGGGLALTPPMGWNGYNRYSRDVTDGIVRSMARALVASGLSRAGYTYVNLDGGWDKLERAPDGELQPDPRKFPHGIAPLAAYVHALGLRFGIYTSIGYRNCAGTTAGSYGHYEQDARTFARWGIDYVKADWCWVPTRKYPDMSHAAISELLAREFGAALLSSGRRIVLDLNDWSDQPPSGRSRGLGNMWRSAPDIRDTYTSMVSNFTRNLAYYTSASPDRWNDPDMLEVGNGGMTATEYRAMFSLWAEMAAPLIAGNDLTRMGPQTLAILSNQAIIAVDQDPLGSQGRPVMDHKGLWVLTKPLANGGRAIVLFNQTNRQQPIFTSVADIGLTGSDHYLLTDLWSGALTSTTGDIGAVVPAHGVVMLTVTPQT